MYLPKHFHNGDPQALRTFIRAHPLAVLVTHTNGVLHVSHVPLLWVAGQGGAGELRGHLARANPQAQGGDVEAIAVFTGPDAYVSPSWYETKRQTGKVVPTWNYAAVYARGVLRFVDDGDAKHGIVTGLTDTFEAPRPEPWSVDDAPEAFVSSQLGAIRGFRIELVALDGKWKMSQNRPDEDRAGVMAGLEASGRPEDQAVLGIMRSLDHGEH